MMIKRVLMSALCVALLLGCAPVALAAETGATPDTLTLAPTGPEVTSKAAVLMEKETGRILYEKDAHKAMAPASVTKVMSLLLICEALEQEKIALTDVVTTSAHAAGMGGSQIYLAEGEQMTVEDLLKSVVLASANDAVVALGEYIAGSEGAFVGMMNDRARELGMDDTHFLNASGLDAEGHLTSAYDIAVMSRELLRHPIIKDYSTIWIDSVRDGGFQLANTNKLIRFYPGATGLKTGSTSIAGCCLAASAERDGMELVCALLAAPSSKERFADATGLLDYGFANYTLVDSFPGGDLAEIAVVLGEDDYIKPVVEGSDKILVDKGLASAVERSIELVDEVAAPVEAGQPLGELVVTSGETELARVPIVAERTVAKLGFWKLYGKLCGKLFMALS